MGCGRSRHRSPSLQARDGPHKDKDSLKENGKDTRDNKRSSGKKHKQAEKQAAKALLKREASSDSSSAARAAAALNSSPNKRATNGKTGTRDNPSPSPAPLLRPDWPAGGAATEKKKKPRDWRLEEAIDTPPETVVAVYRSSVPASARASLKATPPCLESSPSSFQSSNGTLLNGGGAQRVSTGATTHQEIEMQMEIPDQTLNKDKSPLQGNAKPVHITSSQLEFFKMLDEKIEKGADYNSDDE